MAGLDWCDGSTFFLNTVDGEQLDEGDDRLYDHELDSLRKMNSGGGQHYLDLSVADPRCKFSSSVNEGTISLSDLNNDPEGLQAVLLTTFDLIHDVKWLKKELKLKKRVPATFCMHPWKRRAREEMLASIYKIFLDVVVHFPGGVTDEANQSSSVHSKLILLEFTDRLRVCITSANANELHWRFRNEVVWVQDFPVASRDRSMRELFHDGSFGWTLAATVAELLKDCSGDRQKTWVTTLAKFDYTGASAALIVSQPGWARPVAARGCHDEEQEGEEDEVSIQLRVRVKVLTNQRPSASAESAAESNEADNQRTLFWMDELSAAPLRKEGNTWELHQIEADPPEDANFWAWLTGVLPPLKRRREQRARLHTLLATVDDGASLRALRAAEHLGFSVSEALEVDDELDGTWTVHLRLSGQLPTGAWSQETVDLLACLEMNLGCIALRDHLSREVWPSCEEVCFTALAPWVEASDASFYDALDEAAGCPPRSSSPSHAAQAQGENIPAMPPPPSRAPPPPPPPPPSRPPPSVSEAQASDGSSTRSSPSSQLVPQQTQPRRSPPLRVPSGLRVLAPPGTDEVEETYLHLQNMDRLATHEDPTRTVGRSNIPNHSKIIARQFRHPETDVPYGWIYVGSHNLTRAAWGRKAKAGCIGGDPSKRTWIGNRELGVLLIEPRDQSKVDFFAGCSSETNLFERARLPFAVPPQPCRNIEERGVYPYEEASTHDEDDEPWSDDAWGNTWQNGWNGWNGWWEYEETTDWQWFADHHRILPSSTWWWWK